MQNPVSQTPPASQDIFDEIRAGFRFVAEHSVSVKIREDRLEAYALSLQPRPPSNTLDDTHHFVSEDPEALAAYIMCLEAVNFGSGYEEDLVRDGWNRIDQSIYYTVSTALKASFENEGVWTPVRMIQVNNDEMHRIFGLPQTDSGQQLATLFSESLNELGQYIADHCEGRFMALIEAAQGRAANLVATLATLSGFADIANYRGRRIPILKRAQIAAGDLNLAFSKAGHSLFSDIDRLTIFADCGLPHVLHLDGVLEYTPKLEARIAQGSLIEAGSDEEVELRCCTGEVFERLAAILKMQVIDLDHLIWHRSVEDAKYLAQPAHRTISGFY